jgi:hypothetical protein
MDDKWQRTNGCKGIQGAQNLTAFDAAPLIHPPQYSSITPCLGPGRCPLTFLDFGGSIRLVTPYLQLYLGILALIPHRSSRCSRHTPISHNTRLIYRISPPRYSTYLFSHTICVDLDGPSRNAFRPLSCNSMHFLLCHAI